MVDNDMHPDVRPEAAEAVPQYCDNDIMWAIWISWIVWILFSIEIDSLDFNFENSWLFILRSYLIYIWIVFPPHFFFRFFSLSFFLFETRIAKMMIGFQKRKKDKKRKEKKEKKEREWGSLFSLIFFSSLLLDTMEMKSWRKNSRKRKKMNRCAKVKRIRAVCLRLCACACVRVLYFKSNWIVFYCTISREIYYVLCKLTCPVLFIYQCDWRNKTTTKW